MKTFETPAMEVIKFSVEDIITASGDQGVGGDEETDIL